MNFVYVFLEVVLSRFGHELNPHVSCPNNILDYMASSNAAIQRIVAYKGSKF